MWKIVMKSFAIRYEVDFNITFTHRMAILIPRIIYRVSINLEVF